jgi:hypothetical protein
MDSTDDGPWIKLSQCGVGDFHESTGELVGVLCPSRFCQTLVPLVDGRITLHEGIPEVADRGPCPWIGVRVVDDSKDFLHPIVLEGQPHPRQAT